VSDDERFVSYAQHGEDVILWRALGDRESCFYVDVGAFDPSYDSVTRALYERGWRGINIEPQPDRIAAFEESRPEDINLSLAIGDRDGVARLRLPDIPGWATTLEIAQDGGDFDGDQILEVPMRRLDTLLPELGITHVDVLKVDVEGTEPAVIRGLLDGPLRPLVCVVEGVAPRVGRSAGDEAVSLLVGAGYLHCLFDGLNHFLTTEASLQPALSVPANPLDDYTTAARAADHADLQRERPHLIASIAALSAENLGLRRMTADSLVRAKRSVVTEKRSARDAGRQNGDRRSYGSPRPALDPSTRAQRRRVTFQRLIRAEPDRHNGVPPPELLSLAVTNPPALDAISLLNESVLGRNPDEGGLIAWAGRLNRGESLVALAHELAQSSEAMARPPEDRARVLSEIAAWESVIALSELGVSAGYLGDPYSPGRVRQAIFVAALFEVAFHRRPEPKEMRVETDKLIAGGGREWLLRAYADRPEVKARFLGEPAPGLRDQVRRWRKGRRYLEAFRQLVAAAEARHVSELLAQLSSVDPTVISRLRNLTPAS